MKKRNHTTTKGHTCLLIHRNEHTSSVYYMSSLPFYPTDFDAILFCIPIIYLHKAHLILTVTASPHLFTLLIKQCNKLSLSRWYCYRMYLCTQFILWYFDTFFISGIRTNILIISEDSSSRSPDPGNGPMFSDI